MKRARISDVGNRAGVSSRTVRRVLEGSSRVAPDTRARVAQALRELDYRPHLLARGLRLQRTNVFGIVTPDLGIEILTKKLAALEREAGSRGYRVMLGVAHTDASSVRHQLEDLAHFCDGIVLIVDWAVGLPPGILELLRDSGAAHVIIDEQSLPSNAVAIDRESGIEEAMLAVHASYRHFSYLCDSVAEERDARCVAFRRTVAHVGAASRSRVLHGETGQSETGYCYGELVGGELPQLAICQNDRIAAGLLKRLYELGVSVPRDVGIVGFDNDSFSPFTICPMSTVAQPVEEIARETFSMLQAQLDGEREVPSRSLKTRFVPRASTP